MKSGETKEFAFGPRAQSFPAGAVNAEAEMVTAGFASGKPDWDADVFWENKNISVETRAQIAGPPAGAQAFVAAPAASAKPDAGAAKPGTPTTVKPGAATVKPAAPAATKKP